jgi:rubrerythrin
MKMWRNLEEVISFAMQKEAGAAALYEEAAKLSKRPDAKAMFNELAAEERKHREILENLERKDVSKYTLERIPDMKMSEYMRDVEFHPDMEYQDILILAIKREEKSRDLYADLAAHADDPELKKLFQALAQEEAKHKLKLETEYDEYVLTEN